MKIHNNKTKIIATYGPACSDPNILTSMVKAGVDVFRFNFSHSSHEQHLEGFRQIRELNRLHGLNIGILADLQGPKIRLGIVEAMHLLEKGSVVEITNREMPSTSSRLYISYEPLPQEANPGELILIDDGKIELRVLETNGKDLLKAKVINGGKISSKKGVNLPDTRTRVPAITEKDRRDLEFAMENGANWIALSFVRSPADVRELKALLGERNSYMKVMAKIEKPEALKEIDAIIEAADGIMIARGDLAIEVPQERMPLIQKDIIRRCIRQARPVVVATQMMESMIENPVPTRAEITDVANAVLDGTDAVMLSGETSTGKHPLQVIQVMEKILRNIEHTDFIYDKELKAQKNSDTFVSDAICFNAARMSLELGARAIIGMTFSGYTGFKLSSYRPKSSILIFTENERLLNALSICWGVKGFLHKSFIGTNTSIQEVLEDLKKSSEVRSGDIVVNVGSMPLAERGRANMVKVSVVE
jgi:pyruvate kinase